MRQDDKSDAQRRGIRRNTLLLALVAIAIYVCVHRLQRHECPAVIADGPPPPTSRIAR